MPSFAKERLEKSLQMLVSEVINHQLTNSNLSFVTVTKVKLSNDKSHLKIFVSVSDRIAHTMKALNSAIGFIKREISQLEKLRKVPQIIFEFDNSFEAGQKIEKLLSQIDTKKN